MQFVLKAVRGNDPVISLAVEAADESEANRQAATLGYTVLSVERRRSWWQGIRLREGFPLIPFSQQLLVLLDAGVPLVEALDSLAAKEHDPRQKEVIRRICVKLREGRTLSDALQEFPAVFPPLYVATVRSNERTGDLVEGLGRYVAYQTQLDAVRGKVASASIYPLVLVGVGLLVTTFLLVYVVPRFSHIYEDMGGNLPLLSRWLLTWGNVVERYGWIIAGGALMLAGFAAWLLARPAVRRKIHEMLWRMPSLGSQMKTYHLARFYRTVGMLLRGGIPAATALQMASGLLHPVLRPHLASAARAISEGKSMSHSLDRFGLATPVALRMLLVGERSGRMGLMMERIAAFHDDEVARWVDWFTRLFEPALMVLIGLIIGLIVLLLYLPIFELAGSIRLR